MTLRFVSFEDTYSIYRDTRTGQLVNLQTGTGRRLVDYWDLDLLAEYRTFIKSGGMHHHFDDHLRENVVTDPDPVDEMMWCERCDEPERDGDDMVYLDRGDSWLCESCIQRYYTRCYDCEQYALDGDVSWVHDEQVCDSCLENNYGYCEHCDTHYHFDFGCGEDHDSDCGCDVPHPRRFKVADVENDTRVSVSLPAGFVSDEGIGAIARTIRSYANDLVIPVIQDPTMGSIYEPVAYKMRQSLHSLSYSAGDVGTQWQTKEGNYTKRLTKFAYKTWGIKVPAALVTLIGNLGSQHSQGTDTKVEYTRELNMSAADFVHEGSCWWTEYASSRCTLKSNGGLGIRSFNGHYENDPTGRAWIQPVTIDEHGHVNETADTEAADGFIVFNGYGDLGGYTPARIVAQQTGMTYCKIGFSYGEAYINNGSGYLVSSVDNVARFTDAAINLDSAVHAYVPSPAYA